MEIVLDISMDHDMCAAHRATTVLARLSSAMSYAGDSELGGLFLDLAIASRASGIIGCAACQTERENGR